jgi:hypothetical protein
MADFVAILANTGINYSLQIISIFQAGKNLFNDFIPERNPTAMD